MTFNKIWRDLVTALLEQPMLESRAGNMQEIVGASLRLDARVDCFLGNERRALDRKYACAETLWYLAGENKTAFIKKFAPKYEQFEDRPGIAYGAYGTRMADQWQSLLRTLKQKNTRQAVLTLYKPDDLVVAAARASKDVPCTLSMQFIPRSGVLHCVVNMRSNDIWLGMPYDVFAFVHIQRILADHLSLSYGTYTHNVGSLHLYSRNRTAALESITAGDAVDDSVKRFPGLKLWENVDVAGRVLKGNYSDFGPFCWAYELSKEVRDD